MGTIRDWVGLAVARARASNTKVGKGQPIRVGWPGQLGLAASRAIRDNTLK